MNEAVWLACEDARKMVEWLRGFASERKLRLFACAFWRWHERPDSEIDPETTRALAYAERWAETGSMPGPSSEPFSLGWRWHPLFARNAADAANWTIRKTAAGYRTTNRVEAAKHQVFLLLEIFGNPFRPVTITPSWLAWNDGTLPKLAQTIYDRRAFDRLPILADALEDAGCTDADILGHLRSPGPHVCGCWALDLILGRQ